MRVTITRRRGRPGPLGDMIEDPACPAWRHRHSMRGYREDGCRCPSTLAVREATLAANLAGKENWPSYQARQARAAQRRAEREALEARMAALPERERYREIDDCPAERHRHPRFQWKAYNEYGCRCPSTIKAREVRLESLREANRRLRQRQRQAEKSNHAYARFSLSKANRRDAEAIALGYRTGKVDRHTIGMAVQMMLEVNYRLTAQQIVWRLDNAGQGPITDRQVQRIIAAIQLKRKRRRLPPLARVEQAA